MEAAAASGGAIMGGRAAAARSGFRGVAAACIWRREMGEMVSVEMERRELLQVERRDLNEMREMEMQMMGSGGVG